MNTDTYKNELYKLRELAVEFATKHPALAPQLSGPSPDPDAERLLEGVAFLTGNIRQKLDDDFPEFAQSLMQMIFPHYLRPLPSATIIQFKPKKILKSALMVNKGTFIDSAEVEETTSRFQTSQPVMVAPVFLSEVKVLEKGSGKRAIELSIRLNGCSLDQWARDGITFYIGGDYVGAADIFLLLQHNLSSIDIQADNSQEVTQLQSKFLEAAGFRDDQQLIPYPSNGFPAYRSVQEFFLFKEKFLFMCLSGLEGIKANSLLTIRFNLDQVSFNLPNIGAERFTLHVSPAINLFEHDAEPIKLTQRQSEVRIRPNKGRARNKSENYEIYSVDSVTENNRRSSIKMEYGRISGFHSGDGGIPVFQTTVRPGEGGKNETYIGLYYPPSMEINNGGTLSIKLSCTNGNLPTKLRPGDINRPTSTTSELVSFENILPPSDSLEIPSGGAVLWRLLSHLSLNFLSLANTDNLQALLSLYIFPGVASRKEELINKNKISGICSVSVEAADRLIRGNVLRGQEILISLDSEKFSGRGDMILFATLLDKLFHSYASFNCFTATTVKEVNSGDIYTWPAKLGDRPLI